MIEMQEKTIEKLKKQSEECREKGKLIFENFQEVDKALKEKKKEITL